MVSLLPGDIDPANKRRADLQGDEMIKLLNDKEAADYLGCGRTKIHEFVKQGKLPYVSFMDGRRFNTDDLDEFIEKHTVRGGKSETL